MTKIISTLSVVMLSSAAHTHVHYHEFIDTENGFPGETPHHMISAGTTNIYNALPSSGLRINSRIIKPIKLKILPL